MEESWKTTARQVATLEIIRAIDACLEARQWFREHFGKGPVPVREMFHQVVKDTFDMDSSSCAEMSWIEFYLANIAEDLLEKFRTAQGKRADFEDREEYYHKVIDEIIPPPPIPKYKVNMVDGATVIDERGDDNTTRPFCLVYGDTVTADHNAKRIAHLLNSH